MTKQLSQIDPIKPNQESPKPHKGKLDIKSSLLKQAKKSNKQAIELMFKQFVSEDETFIFVEHMGTDGLWGFGRHSFVCLTNRRLAAIEVAAFGKVTYQDVYIEHINGIQISRPSLFIIISGTLGITFAFLYQVLIKFQINETPLLAYILNNPNFLIGLLFVFVGLPIVIFAFVARFYYRRNNSGLILSVREAPYLYIFANPHTFLKMSNLYRKLTEIRDIKSTV